MKQHLFLAIGLALTFATTAHAHPGHGQSGASSELSHYLSEPIHLAVIVGVMALLVVGLLIVARPGSSRARDRAERQRCA